MVAMMELKKVENLVELKEYLMADVKVYLKVEVMVFY